MDLACDFVGELLLGNPLARVSDVLAGDVFDFVLGRKVKNFEVFDGILIGGPLMKY
jgi:hypothetical protein